MAQLQHAAAAIVLVLFVMEASGKDLSHYRRDQFSPYSYLGHRGVCGDELMKAFKMVCDKQRSKKSIPDGEDEDYWKVMDETSTFPFRPRRLSRTLIPMRVRRGIVDECCKKPCTWDEMNAYCPENYYD